MSVQSKAVKKNKKMFFFRDVNLHHFTDNVIKFRCILCGVLLGLSLSAATEAHAVICQNTSNTGAVNATGIGAYSLACGGAPGGAVLALGDGSTAIGGNGARALVGNDVAVGSGAVANGIDNAPTPSANGQAAALGPNSHATGNAAIGIGRDSNATGSQALAVGGSSGNSDGATATGYYATAIGGGAVANGNTATSTGAYSNSVGLLSSAYGYGAQATAANSTALGANASTAGFAGSTAIGVGATNSATNQMMLGTTSTTYVAAGITSAASTAAQSGTIKYVTTDANGHLAATDAPTVDLSGVNNSIGSLNNSVNLLGANVSGLWQNVGALKQSVQRGYEGSAVAISQTGPVISRDSRFGISAKWGTFRGQNAFGAQAQYRVNNNIVLSAGVGAGFRYGGVGGGAGGLLEW